jgi:antitoxin YefM
VETLSLSELKARLNEYATRVEVEHEQLAVTRNGRPSVVLVSADDWESLQETLYWLSQPGIHEDLAQAEADIAAGRVYSEAEIRRALNLPARSR